MSFQRNILLFIEKFPPVFLVTAITSLGISVISWYIYSVADFVPNLRPGEIVGVQLIRLASMLFAVPSLALFISSVCCRHRFSEQGIRDKAIEMWSLYWFGYLVFVILNGVVKAASVDYPGLWTLAVTMPLLVGPAMARLIFALFFSKPAVPAVEGPSTPERKVTYAAMRHFRRSRLRNV